MLYLIKYSFELFSVKQIAIVKRDFFSRYLLDSFECRGLAVGFCHAVCKVIYSYHIIATLQELDDAVATDVTGTPRYENGPPVSRHLPHWTREFNFLNLRTVRRLLLVHTSYDTNVDIFNAIKIIIGSFVEHHNKFLLKVCVINGERRIFFFKK